LLRSLRDSEPSDRLAIEDHVSSGALYTALKEIRKRMKREGRCSSEPISVTPELSVARPMLACES
jgi:flagellar biosynthesis regulator FlbT